MKSILKKQTMSKKISYQNMFWLFMIANVIGVLLEGIWTVIQFGRWETHVNVIWGPFCLIYGIGAVVFYIGSVKLQGKNLVIQFFSFALFADIVEYLCAWLIEDALYMKAWTYKKHFMNLHGRISLQMTIIWGIIGVVYLYLVAPRLNRLFMKMQSRFFIVGSIVLTVFMVVNLIATSFCLVRWSERHKEIEPTNKVERYIDKTYDDARMKKLFCEWWFIDEGKEFWKEYKSR